MPDLTEKINPCAYDFCPEFPEGPNSNPSERDLKLRFKSIEKMKDTEKRIKDIINDLNVTKDAAEVYYAIFRQLMKSHRTLQQSFVGVVLKSIVDTFAYMDDNNLTDARNESSAKLCKELKEVMDKHYLPFV